MNKEAIINRQQLFIDSQFNSMELSIIILFQNKKITYFSTNPFVSLRYVAFSSNN